MSEWTILWPEAEEALASWRAQITREIEATRRIVSRLVPPGALTIEVKHKPGAVIPEIGMVGHAWGPHLFSLTFDSGNPNFAASLKDGTLRRQIAHEVNHCLRNAGPGYGLTLGEAFVSEGLAGHFVNRLFGTPPEPWERAVETARALSFLPDATSLASTDFDHNAWFFGVDRRYPRWLGYTLGYVIVGRWLAVTPDADGPLLVNVAAADVLAAARRH